MRRWRAPDSLTAGDTRCWVCDSQNTHAWRKGRGTELLQSDDLRISDPRYGTTLNLHRCRDCGFRFAEAARAEQLASLYEGLTDPEYEGSQLGRRRQMRSLVSLALEAHPGAKTALDVGAASGLLVSEAERAGMQAVGVEPSRSLAELARREQGVAVHQGVLPHPELEGRRFDVVFLVDVIEHVVDPIDLLDRCVSQLADDGVLLLVTPDMASLSAKLLQRRCWHYRLAHVGYFERPSLELALSAAGLRAFAWQRPEWFFPLGYLATRLEAYLPVAGLNRLAQRVAPLRSLYTKMIRLRIPDSHVVLARRHVGSAASLASKASSDSHSNQGAVPLCSLEDSK